MKKGLFVDRDGILNKVVMRGTTVGSPRSLDEFEIIHSAKKIVELAKEKGYRVIVVTNQPDVARGFMSLEELNKIHKRLEEEIAVDEICVCASEDDSDVRRKPNPGMILEMLEKHGLERDKSIVVGDGRKDIEAGRRAGMRTVLVQTSYNIEIHGIGDFNVSSLDAVSSLL